MNSDDFRRAAHQAIEDVITYHESLATSTDPPLSQVKPGYLRPLVGTNIPELPEAWKDIHGDIESKIFPGITHWQHPNFFAYFPANFSYAGLLGDIYSTMFTCAAFNWQCSPAITELETIVLDWFQEAIGLPTEFSSKNGHGGGVLQGTASEAVVVAMMAARERMGEGDVWALCSDQSHSSVVKAGKITRVKTHSIEAPPPEFGLTITSVEEGIAHVESQGGRVCMLVLTLGTTSSCAVDDIPGIQEYITRHHPEIWVHVDAAYAGAALICPELRPFNIPLVDSFNFNLHKWLLVPLDASAMYVRQRTDITSALSIVPFYLKNKSSDSGDVIDYRDWGIPLGRRFRSMKIWLVARTSGLSGMQQHIRKGVRLGELFAGLVESSKELHIFTQPRFGLTVFRVDNDDELTRRTYERINGDGKIFLTCTLMNGKYAIRLVSGGQNSQESHIRNAFEMIVNAARIEAGVENSKEVDERTVESEHVEHTPAVARGV